MMVWFGLQSCSVGTGNGVRSNAHPRVWLCESRGIRATEQRDSLGRNHLGLQLLSGEVYVTVC